jgi:hypothetical protein
MGKLSSLSFLYNYAFVAGQKDSIAIKRIKC